MPAAMANSVGGAGDDSWEYTLRKYLLLLATLVATVTYGAGFNPPPGGVWQAADPSKNRVAGDPIIRETDHPRYLAFFYSNATAFASSLVVIVLILILSILHDRGINSPAPVRILRGVMLLDLVSVMVAYAAGTFRDVLTAVYSLVLLAGVIAYLVVHLLLAARSPPQNGSGVQMDAAKLTEAERRLKVLMLLATFAVSVTYVAGLSAPGGFWDHPEDGHRPGDAILKGGPHDARLKAFFVCNTTAFVASLLILVMLLDKKLRFSQKVSYSYESYLFIGITLAGLMAAYAAGASRNIDTSIYISALVGVVVVCILLQAVFVFLLNKANSSANGSNANGSDGQQGTEAPQASTGNGGYWHKIKSFLSGLFSLLCSSDEQPHQNQDGQTSNGNVSDQHEQQPNQALEKARSLVLLLATLAVTITYQAGLNPPGGLWQNDGDGYMTGDPILLTTNPRRYKAFYYCNSIAFVASLVAIVMVRMQTLHHHNALEAAMILDLFGLIGSYAAGSCRDVATSVYAMALAGAVLVYVVIHVVFFTLDDNDPDSGRRTGDEEKKAEEEKEALVEKRRKRLLLFAILAATITYQAGLTPPGGFLGNDDAATGHRAGDPVLLNNYHRRYTAFFYCNSVSFMLSIALIILLVNPNLYRPAIRSNALSVCTAAGLMGIMGGYAAGSTQHIRTSIYIFVLAAVVLCSVVLLVVVFFVMHLGKQQQQDDQEANADGNTDAAVGSRVNVMGADESSSAPVVAETEEHVLKEKKLHAKRKYLMLLGILVASVTYQAGLAPPGGAWQTSSDGTHAAGDPVMHDNRRARYLVFFYSNSVSFVASVVVIVLLLPSLLQKTWWLRVMKATIVLDLLGLLVAYAAGSSRKWKTSVNVSALVVAVLGYFVIHVALSCLRRSSRRTSPDSGSRSSAPARRGDELTV